MTKEKKPRKKRGKRRSKQELGKVKWLDRFIVMFLRKKTAFTLSIVVEHLILDI